MNASDQVERIIVSVRYHAEAAETDLELPNDVPMRVLAPLVARALARQHSGSPVAHLPELPWTLRILPSGRALGPNESLWDADVWDGARLALEQQTDAPAGQDLIRAWEPVLRDPQTDETARHGSAEPELVELVWREIP